MNRDPFKAIVEAAGLGRGVRLSAEECFALAREPSIVGRVGQHWNERDDGFYQIEWRPIPDCARYEVSEFGEVRREYRVLKQTESRSRHMSVTVYRDSGKQWRAGVHHLVALAFHGPAPAGKPFACHRNGRPWQNSKDNIYWGSRAENTADMVRHASLRRNVEEWWTLPVAEQEFLKKDSHDRRLRRVASR